MRVRNTDDIPGFLLPLRQKAAGFARLAPAELQQALVTEYTPGAAIGWHRDRPAYRDVIGVSFSSSCRFRFKRKLGSSWERASLIVEPRSVYLLRGPARTEWQHSIPPAERLRYSVTFRSMRGSPKSGSARGGVSGRDRSLASRPFRLQSVRHAMGRCGARDHVLVTGIEPASDFLGDLHGYCRGPGKLTNS